MVIEKNDMLRIFGQAYSVWQGFLYTQSPVESTTKQSITKMFTWGENNLHSVVVIFSQLETGVDRLIESNENLGHLPRLSHLINGHRLRMSHRLLSEYFKDFATNNDSKSFVNLVDAKGLIEFLMVSIYAYTATNHFDQSINQVDLMHDLRAQISAIQQ